MSDTERTETKNLSTVAITKHTKNFWLTVETSWFQSEIEPCFRIIPQPKNATAVYLRCKASECPAKIKAIHNEETQMTSYNQSPSHKYNYHKKGTVPIPAKYPAKRNSESPVTELKLREENTDIPSNIIDLENEGKTTFSPSVGLLQTVKVEDITLLSPVLDGMTTYFSGDPNLKVVKPYIITLFNDKEIQFVFQSHSYENMMSKDCMITVYRDPLQVNDSLAKINGCIITKFHHDNHTTEIKLIGVSNQGNGVGSTLMKNHINYSIIHYSSYDIVIDAVETAKRFYLKLGFEIVAKRLENQILNIIRDEFFDGRINMVVMKLNKKKFYEINDQKS